MIGQTFYQAYLLFVNNTFTNKYKGNTQTIPVGFPIRIFKTNKRIGQMKKLTLQMLITTEHIH